MITIREMPPEEADRIAEIDLSEDDDIVYYWINGRVEAVPEAWRRPRLDPTGWWERIAAVKADLAIGATLWGAFDDEKLIGVIVLRHCLPPVGAFLGQITAQLAALWVDNSYRRQGVARRLADTLIRAAQASGAEWLYVSATPSRSAVGFYTSLGFLPTQNAHPELYALEPDDIHMIRPL